MNGKKVDKEKVVVNVGLVMVCMILLVVIVYSNIHSISNFTENRASLNNAEEQSGIVSEVVEHSDDLFEYLFDNNESITVKAKENMSVEVGEIIKYKTYPKKSLLKKEPEEVTRIVAKKIED